MRMTTIGSLRLAVWALVAAWTWNSAPAAERRPMEPLDMLKIEQLNNPEVSPDGNWLLYERSTLNWKLGRRFTDIHVSRMDGGEARRIRVGDANFEVLGGDVVVQGCGLSHILYKNDGAKIAPACASDLAALQGS